MNATEKQYVEKLKELVEHLYKGFKFQSEDRIEMFHEIRIKLESEISVLEQQIKEPEDELRERKTSNTGRGHGNNFCPENCD